MRTVWVQDTQVTTRERGEIPGCKPPRHTQTWLEENNVRKMSPLQAVKEWAEWCDARKMQHYNYT